MGSDFDLSAIYEAILPYIVPTPLIAAPLLQEYLGFSHPVWLKCENLQNTGSFKVRGAANLILSNLEEARARGVVARSSGNFAQAVAYLARELGLKATLVMPEDAPKVKVAGVKSYGSEVLFAGVTHPEGYAKVAELEQTHNYLPVNAVALDATLGQGTVGFEVMQQRPTIRHFLAPAGTGGLLAGSAYAVKEVNPSATVWGVEPSGANDLSLSLSQGERVSFDSVDTIADGLRANTTGLCNWPLICDHVDGVQEVPDDAICEAMRFLYHKMGLFLEPSGATSVAALFANRDWTPAGDVVCVLSGGNVDRGRFFELIA